MSLLLLKIYSSSGVQRLGYEGSALHGSVKFEVPGGFQAPKGAPPPPGMKKELTPLGQISVFATDDKMYWNVNK